MQVINPSLPFSSRPPYKTKYQPEESGCMMMANYLELTRSSTQTSTPDDPSALQKLIRKVGGITTALKEFSLSDKDHYWKKSEVDSGNDGSYHLIPTNHPLRQLIPSLFLSDPAINSRPKPSPVEYETMSDEFFKRQRVLDGFLKNNGGYLDDSGSSSAASDLDDETSDEDAQGHDGDHANSINILAKKYQPEITTNDDETTTTMAAPGATKRNSYTHQLISNKLPKRLLCFSNNNSDHRKPATFVINKPADQSQRVSLSPSNHQHLLENHRNRTAKPFIESLQNCQALKHGQERDDRIASAYSKFTRDSNTRPDFQENFYPVTRGCMDEERCGTWCERQEDEAALSLNVKYLQSSTFPTRNSILESHSPPHPGRTLAPSSSHSSSRTLRHPSSLCSSNLADDSHPHSDEFKSPFRNLVLGQDDLLRSN
ncbi:hypothetical protein PCASD_07061 [Puccinia coronata f. sp. avenae]|uniref:Uncharacterized protein n=2 Tax=Puccinia coronata f. sp. avenae TaxID=200324 RepID=A0A2N5V6N4_9BASI|nr:hypothetical protein PCASD_07061 [Puccinia coronata f. sp. avenae]